MARLFFDDAEYRKEKEHSSYEYDSTDLRLYNSSKGYSWSFIFICILIGTIIGILCLVF